MARILNLILPILIVFGLMVVPVNAHPDLEISFEDAEGDVIDEEGYQVNHPDVDIIEVETYLEGEMLNFVMRVAGSIRGYSDDYSYMFYVLEEKETTIGEAVVTVGIGGGQAFYTTEDLSKEETSYEVSESELIISVPIDVFEGLSDFHIYTLANYRDPHTPHRAIDNAYSWQEPPDDDVPPPNDEVLNGDDNDTPWIGVIVTLFSISVAVLLKKGKKQFF